MGHSGQYITNLSGEAAYKSFRPAPLPPEINMDRAIATALADAARALATLDTLSAYIPNMNLFVSMYVRKEALMSSQIEGTQATLEDVLDPLIEQNANQNVADVINYIKATEYALERLSKLPLCNRLIKETHAVLMAGVRGQEKSPGEFCTSQNWIGAAGSTLRTARYIPPTPEDMIEAVSDLEKYINSDDALDVLIQAALLHYCCSLSEYLYNRVPDLLRNGLVMDAFELVCLVFQTGMVQDMDDSDGGLTVLANSCMGDWNKILELASTEK